MKQEVPHLCTATKEPILLDGTILLFVNIGELRMRVWFGIVEILAVDILLGTSFIERYIRGLFPSDTEVLPWHSPLVQILSRNNFVAFQYSLSEQDWAGVPVKTDRVPRETMVAPRNQTSVLLTGRLPDCFRLNRHR